MKREVVFSAKADSDLASIFDYIAQRSEPEQAYRYVERIKDFCLTLHTFPERGAPWGHILSGVRIVGFERRVSIAFRVKTERVTILRVLYGGRDISASVGKK